MFYVHEKCKITDFKFSKVMQQHTQRVVGSLIWILLEIYCLYSSERILQIDQELTKL